MFFGLNGVDGIELMQIRQTQIGSFQALNLLLKLLFHVVLLLGQAKISNLQLHSCIIDENVSRFDVTMNEAFFVNMLKPIDKLLKEVEDHLSIYYVILIVQKFS